MGIQHTTNSPAVLTVSETAVYFRISRASVWRLLRTGQLKKVRIGGRTLVRRVDADAFLESCVGAA
ncbi:MAG: helix-turn-helix domain-containing protein [Mesorhizobium sp.]|nr:MAG: helix-turn-helix domain-containing protein [Mesorhizobium sp.]TIW07453.1 MAG: helix-turn-helix domain-containing protein [Mesorhizobium sp.]